jgi:hypothetical protein
VASRLGSSRATIPVEGSLEETRGGQRYTTDYRRLVRRPRYERLSLQRRLPIGSTVIVTGAEREDAVCDELFGLEWNVGFGHDAYLDSLVRAADAAMDTARSLPPT